MGILLSMLEITPTLQIDERELHFDFVRSAGPGGQNVNKVATAVQLRFAIPASTLPETVKARLIKLGGKRVTQDGVLIIEAKSFRTQEQNKEAAVQRLITLVKRAAERPKPRRKTRPSLASKQKRLKEKKQHGEVKKLRQNRLLD
jgi:ribosome-associated protein